MKKRLRYLNRPISSSSLKISRFLLTDWRKKGIIKTVQIGGRVLIKRTEVERLLNENEN